MTPGRTDGCRHERPLAEFQDEKAMDCCWPLLAELRQFALLQRHVRCQRYTQVTRGSISGLASISGRHLSEALLLPAELYPRLCAVAIDFRLRLHPAAVVQSANAHHHNARQRIPLIYDAGAVLRAEATMHRLAGVSRFGERLERSRCLQRRRWQSHHRREGGAGEALAIGAVAHTDKDGFRVRAVTHLPAQAATFDVCHDISLLFALPKTATPA